MDNYLIMDDSRYNAYGTHCLNNLLIQTATPMGDEEQNETLYLLRRASGPENSYLTHDGKWRGDLKHLMVVFIDRTDAERFRREQYSDHEIEEITGAELTRKLDGKYGINFRYVADGKPDEINVPPVYFQMYDQYQQAGRPKVSTSEFLRTCEKVPDFLSAKKMKIIRDTFESLEIEGAVVSVATIKLMGAPELVVDFDREGGFLRAELDKIERANKRLQMRFAHPVPFFVNAEIDHSEPAPRPVSKANRPERDPAEIERIKQLRRQRKQRKQSKAGKPSSKKAPNGKESPPDDDGIVCAELTAKIKRKQKTMEHPFVKHLARAQEEHQYEAIDVKILDDEAYDVFLHLDLEGEYIVTKDGVDVFLDEPMWRRSFDPKIHSQDQAQKTIRELLEFVEENQVSVRLFYPDRDGIDFIRIPFAQLHQYHDFMPRETPTNIDELRTLPRIQNDVAQSLCDQANDAFRGVPGTAAHVYVADDDGRSVLVVEIEEIKPLTDITDGQLVARSINFEKQLPQDVTYRFKVVPPLERGSNIDGPAR